MISIGDIESAQRAIAKRFIVECGSGPQVLSLPADMKACGQFLGSGSPQRGLHGTAAAIRVLASDGRSPARQLVPQLIAYVGDRDNIESKLSGGTVLTKQLQRDSQNVIKLSELLFALSFVERAVAPTDTLKADLATRLQNGMIDRRGWGYFLSSGPEPELLPTAYAVRALASHDYDVSAPVEFIVNSLRVPPHQTTAFARTDVSVRVLGLYTLGFLKNQEELVNQSLLKELFLPIWRSLERVFYDDLEQNIEYSVSAEHFYLRIPYQLYLMGLAAKLAPFRSFASHAMQRRLKSVLNAVESPEGFVYPHSGHFVSSRTNAILYDVLLTIKEEIPRHSAFLFPAYSLNQVRRFLNSPLVVWAGYLLAIGLMVASTYSWLAAGMHLSDLAPHFLSWAVVFILSIRKAT
jgi:hypothetical protein